MRRLYIGISKFLSYILRHGPQKVGLELDSDGYANLNTVLIILNKKFRELTITRQTLEDIIKQSEKRRFEIVNSKIRAFYGHSINEKIRMKESRNLPSILYHGTSLKAYDSINTEGLIRKTRQYVHLSDTIETAIMVGKRKTNNPLILKIDVKSALNEGIKFYKSGDMYLADFIPSKFIKKT